YETSPAVRRAALARSSGVLLEIDAVQLGGRQHIEPCALNLVLIPIIPGRKVSLVTVLKVGWAAVEWNTLEIADVRGGRLVVPPEKDFAKRSHVLDAAGDRLVVVKGTPDCRRFTLRLHCAFLGIWAAPWHQQTCDHETRDCKLREFHQRFL